MGESDEVAPDVQAPAKEYILEIKTYVDQFGSRITDRLLTSGTAPEGFVRFQGHVVVEARTAAGEVIRLPVDFPIPLPTLQDAFRAFKVLAEHEGKSRMAALAAENRRRSLMVLAGTQLPPSPGQAHHLRR